MQIERLDVRRGATLPYPPSGLPDPAGGEAEREAPAPRRPSPRGGRLLPCRLGRYTLFDHIGQGGMADLYLARARTDLGAARLVAIKEVVPRLARDPRFVEMLASEAKLAAALRHASIVQVEDLGREDGALFIAMEYVEGLDLRELLRRCARQRVKLPVAFSLLIVVEALQALAYAHRKGVVHRDVSPSNVLLSFEGEIKLCDFGIARAHERSEAPLSDVLQGKAGYMSPEQARGEPPDVRSDVFATGILLWELLAGRRMYSVSGAASLSKEDARDELLDLARRAVIPPLPERGLPDEPSLHAIVSRALAASPDDRYPTAAAMLRDLAAYAAAADLTASPLRFGAWLRDNFGAEMLSARRARERAVRALELGPPAVLEPVALPAAPLAPLAPITPLVSLAPLVPLVPRVRTAPLTPSAVEPPSPWTNTPRALAPVRSRALPPRLVRAAQLLVFLALCAIVCFLATR
ncbi:serine/threonine-protein kinase [Sorangium sp. So ce131]|uniref:serine/threonine-protein kinase n=1 Tax=Sorangium sp. So ce131 TaxID=3133282 RepID=UPI003F62DA67